MRQGQVLSGQYRLESRLGLGGMGEVWRATDTRLDRTVALKLLRFDLADDAESRRRFRQEARNLAKLAIPGIARIHDAGEEEVNGDTLTYLVMEYVPGKTLAQILTERGTLATTELMPILEQIAQTLDNVHRNGIVHRDIKPSNVMVGENGSATLLDFGIARSVDNTKVTRTGQVMGTLSYVSPEQLNGGPVDPESDVYSLAAVVYECLVGEPPFTGEPLEILNGHLRTPPPDPPSSIPETVARALKRALAKAPQDRFHTASDFVAGCAGKLPDAFAERPRGARGFFRRMAIPTAAVLAIALIATAIVVGQWYLGTGDLIPPDDGKPSGGWIPEGLDDGTLLDSRDGVIYRVDDKGYVYWYRHTDPKGGESAWAKGSGKRIGGDWKGRKVLAASNGILYALDDKGDLFWYRHTDPKGGSDRWSPESGTLVGHDFDEYIHIFVAADDILHTVDEKGRLYWNKHSSPADGPVEWLPGSGTEIGSGWDGSLAAFVSGGDGVLYVLRPNGDLLWHSPRDFRDFGTPWDRTTIAEGWDEYDSFVASSTGVIYARTRDGQLYWFRHLNPDNGLADWSSVKGKRLNPG